MYISFWLWYYSQSTSSALSGGITIRSFCIKMLKESEKKCDKISFKISAKLFSVHVTIDRIILNIPRIKLISLILQRDTEHKYNLTHTYILTYLICYFFWFLFPSSNKIQEKSDSNQAKCHKALLWFLIECQDYNS